MKACLGDYVRVPARDNGFFQVVAVRASKGFGELYETTCGMYAFEPDLEIDDILLESEYEELMEGW